MKSKFLMSVWTTCVALTLVAVAGATAFAQESEPVVVDEVVAQVNTDVVTLSMIKREMKEVIEALKQKGMTDEQAAAEAARRQPELILSLIDEQLLTQKSKELNLTQEIEDEINRRLLDLAKQQGLKTLESLDDAMRASNVDPANFRQSARTGITTGIVLSREVDAKIFYGSSLDELKKYYAAHPDQFRKSESVTLSEIFLSFAGKSEADVIAKADALVAQARKPGTDFGALSAANSEREQAGARTAPQSKGKLGAIQVTDLNAPIAAAIKTLKAGGVSDPIRTDEGLVILRVDERTAAGGSTFSENQVREAITAERGAKERAAYLQKLRADAYINIAKDYRAAVLPLLNTGANAATTVATTNATGKSSTTPAPETKSSGKKSKSGNDTKRPQKSKQ
ncbi:MAG: peptidylprolyl isomerase [Pyrinomonadaceae bacterium]